MHLCMYVILWVHICVSMCMYVCMCLCVYTCHDMFIKTSFSFLLTFFKNKILLCNPDCSWTLNDPASASRVLRSWAPFLSLNWNSALRVSLDTWKHYFFSSAVTVVSMAADWHSFEVGHLCQLNILFVKTSFNTSIHGDTPLLHFQQLKMKFCSVAWNVYP